jgi:hypothetical protein
MILMYGSSNLLGEHGERCLWWLLTGSWSGEPVVARENAIFYAYLEDPDDLDGEFEVTMTFVNGEWQRTGEAPPVSYIRLMSDWSVEVLHPVAGRITLAPESTLNGLPLDPQGRDPETHLVEVAERLTAYARGLDGDVFPVVIFVDNEHVESIPVWDGENAQIVPIDGFG